MSITLVKIRIGFFLKIATSLLFFFLPHLKSRVVYWGWSGVTPTLGNKSTKKALFVLFCFGGAKSLTKALRPRKAREKVSLV